MPRILLYGAAILVGATPLALSAAAPPDAGPLLDEQQRANPVAPRPVDPPGLRPDVVPTADVADGLRIRLRSVHFSGATGLVFLAALQALGCAGIRHPQRRSISG